MSYPFLTTSWASAPKAISVVPKITAIEIGTISIPLYPLMIAVGAVAMLVYTWVRRDRFGLNRLQSILFAVILTMCGIAGAKLLFILENLRDYLSNRIRGGVSFYGSVYLIPLMMPLFGYLFRMKPSRTMDLCGPCVALMICCIRIGCLFNGCCGGKVVYVGDYYFSWPTQIMESVGDFCIFLWLSNLESKESQRGILYPLLMLSYSIMRFFIEFLRYSPNKFLFLSNGHWFALAAIGVAYLWIIVHKRNNNKQTTGQNR